MATNSIEMSPQTATAVYYKPVPRNVQHGTHSPSLAEHSLSELSTTSSINRSLSGKERLRWPPLTRMLMSGELTDTSLRSSTWKEKFDVWMINEGWRKFFVGAFALLHGMVFAFGFMNYYLKDTFVGARSVFGLSYSVARAAALVLHVDVALILLPVCRTLISLARQTPLNGVIQLDKNIAFHKLVAWSIVFFSWLHTIAHWNNFAQLAAKQKLGFVGFLIVNLSTGPGWSGYVMLTALMAMLFTSVGKMRKANYERFWYTHHLFIIFFIFWSVHGEFCMVKQDRAPYCAGTGVFYQYWVLGGFLYLCERIAREVRGKHKTLITKVIQHPSQVCEIQIKKEHTVTRAGQYIFLCCPEISLYQYHPFTLTSAPEEDFLSVHIRCHGDFTKALAKALGCDFSLKSLGTGKTGNTGKTGHADNMRDSFVIKDYSDDKNDGMSDCDFIDTIESSQNLRITLPRLYLDGPFGSASEDVFKFEVAVLVGAGIGVTPFASILKSIWYRMNYPKAQTRLRKVYFFWIIRDFGSLEWFRSLLLAIEAEDLGHAIEIHTYLTAKITPEDATNIMLNDANAEQDAITGLKSPTNFGRPNWDTIFKGIRKIHSPTEAGVFFCGPKPLGSVLHVKCNQYSGRDFRYVWGKENF